MPATTFAELFGAVFPAEADVESGVEYTDGVDDFVGTLVVSGGSGGNVVAIEGTDATDYFDAKFLVLQNLIQPVGSTKADITILKTGSIPVAGATVIISSSITGSPIIGVPLTTNSNGVVSTFLVPGIYYLFIDHPDIIDPEPQEFTHV